MWITLVWASAGRFNGWAVTLATSKAQAKKIANECGWLDTGKVDRVQTLDEYTKEVEEDEEHLKGDISRDLVEVEWGT